MVAALVLLVSFLVNEDRKDADDDCWRVRVAAESDWAGGVRGSEPRPVRSMLALFCCRLTYPLPLPLPLLSARREAGGAAVSAGDRGD